MAKKKPPEEHENLERYLVSYADFMTLMFATFVVLYALSQTDVNSFKGIEEALRRAFSQSIFENNENIMDGSESIFEGAQGQTNPLMLEYMSPKYEQSSFEEIKDEIDKLKDEGISATIDERGLVIRLDNHAVQFNPGSAQISTDTYKTLDYIGKLIKQKFSIHYIQVEGHTDSDPISNHIYPSNWELSSARASSVIRYLIKKFDFNPRIFMAVGLADTVSASDNPNSVNKAKDRRVEIVVLRNKNRFLSKKNMQQIIGEVRKANRNKKQVQKEPSEAIEHLIGNDKEMLNNVIDLTDTYNLENKRIELLESNDYTYDGNKPDFME